MSALIIFYLHEYAIDLFQAVPDGHTMTQRHLEIQLGLIWGINRKASLFQAVRHWVTM